MHTSPEPVGGTEPAVAPGVAPAPAPGPSAAAAPRHLLGLAGLSDATWQALLAAADRLAGPAGHRPLLAGRRLGLVLLNPSLRTRVSFEVAAGDLGARAVVLQPGREVWGLEHRAGVVMDGEAAEHVTEAIGVLGRMVDALGLRCFARLADAAEDRDEPVLRAVAAAARVPVLNLESAYDHPHQGLADALTLRRTFGRRPLRVVLRWAPHVKPLPMAVPNAALLAFAREGHELVVAHPPGFELDATVMERARDFAAAAGGRVRVEHDRVAALEGADAVYVKSWGAPGLYGRPQEASDAFAAHRDWMLRAAELGSARFLHCLPVRRNVVVADDVLDGPASLVLEQASARLHVQKATLCHALGVEP